LDGYASELSDFVQCLSDTERRRAERFHFDRDRDRFIARHGLLRRILASYLGIAPARISLANESRGKPVLADSTAQDPLHFNLTHSDGLALFAVSRLAPVGIDVERVKPIPDADQVAARFFSPQENVALHTLPGAQMVEGFFNCWTRKEAYLKATGEGIANSLPEVEVSLAPSGAAQLLCVSGDIREAARWTIHPLVPAPGWVGALAVKARDVTPVCRRWPGVPPSPPHRAEPK
jgi:4'-phosphopantetheinyl transferase